jgi:hypothetical protein
MSFTHCPPTENLWIITFEKGSKRLPWSHCQLFYEETDVPSTSKDFFS